MVIFLDETGYTGEDLANRDQPVFVLASHNFTEDESLELKNRFFGRVQAAELKHSNLSKYFSQQRMVVNFLQFVGENHSRIKLSVAYKPYALLAKMVDSIIEPAAHLDGIDLYDRGANLALTNLLFYCIPAFADDNFFFDLLFRFQELFRLKTPEAYDLFFGPLFNQFTPKELDELIDWLRIGHMELGFKNLMGNIPNNYLDIAFAMSLKLMSNWQLEIKEPVRLIHDASSNMSKQKAIWDALVDPNLDPAVIGWDRRTLSLPIAVSETIFDNSRNWAGLQIADVLAGATARFMQWQINGSNPDDAYGTNLSTLMRDWTFDGVIFPETKVTPDELGTTGENSLDPFSHLSKIMNRSAK